MSTRTSLKSHKDGAGGELPVVIRASTGSDRAALRRVAERDSRRVPAEPLIVAAVGDEVRAAVSVSDGRLIADPFHRTAELAALAELRAAQLRSARRKPLPVLAPRPSVARPACDTSC